MGRLGRFVAWAVVAGLVLGWVVLLRPERLGGPATYVVVRGDSMEPAYHAGDLVIVEAQARYHLGDIVAYRVPAGGIGAGRLVIHRIVGGDKEAGFVVRGDHNPAPDPWAPRASDVVGAAWLVIPGAGQGITLVRMPAVAGALAATTFVAAFAWKRLQPVPPSPTHMAMAMATPSATASSPARASPAATASPAAMASPAARASPSGAEPPAPPRSHRMTDLPPRTGYGRSTMVRDDARFLGSGRRASGSTMGLPARAER